MSRKIVVHGFGSPPGYHGKRRFLPSLPSRHELRALSRRMAPLAVVSVLGLGSLGCDFLTRWERTATARTPLTPASRILYVGGGFNSEPSAVYAFSLPAQGREVTSIAAPLALPVAPTYLVPRDRHVWFAAIENTPGQIAALRMDPADGTPSLVNLAPSGGATTTHVALDPSGRWLFAAHYDSGSVTVLSVSERGTVGSIVDREEAGATAQAHGVTVHPSNRHVYVPYKGIDRVGQYDFDPTTGQLTPMAPPYVDAPPGSGPRHMALHPTLPFAYVVNEFASSVSRYAVDASRGTLVYQDSVSALPEGYTLPNTGAEIQVAPSGRFLYASNRGHDSIAVFSIDSSKGSLQRITTIPTQGKTPRMFALSPDGELAAVANQDSRNVVLFRVDTASGSWSPFGATLTVDKPSWVGFVGGAEPNRP